MYQLEYTNEFKKRFKKLSKNEKKQVSNKLRLLSEDPFYPSLRTKKVFGLDGIFEMSVNMDIRIFWRYNGDRILLVLEIGHHKEILGV